jgi:sucrose-6-phosphate hydrolase SacC (GH32 family)
MVTPVPMFNEDDRYWELQLIMDRSIVEVFLNKGLRAGTMTVWPEQPYDTLVVSVEHWNEDIGKVNVKVQDLRLPEEKKEEEEKKPA